MLRRQVRQRKEYLFQKHLEHREQATFEKKNRLRDALESNKSVPHDLRGKEGLELRKKLDLDDDVTKEQHQVIDDEYAFMGVKDPKIVLTSARDPSARLMQFLKEFRVLFPNCQRVNRGTQTMKDFVEMCRKNDVSDIITVHEHRGKPDGLIISHLPYGPTAYFSLKNVNMRHDLETKPAPMSEANPHLIFHDFDTPLGKRVQTILQALFPPAAPQGQRVMTFANARDTIHYRHYNFGYDSKKKNVKPEEVDLKECGPRFSMMLYKIELGTLDMTDAKVEWVLRPYFNKQKDALKDNSAQQALGTS